MSLQRVITTVRESVVAIFRYKLVNAQTREYRLGWGSGFCAVADRYVITAFHVLNGGQPRDPADTFLAFVVPGNGDPAFHFPVIGFPVERSDVDLAVLEIGPCARNGVHLPAIPVSFGAHSDGDHVATLGFPAPEVAGLNIDAQGRYVGGAFFLKSHANEGIIAAQYRLGPHHVYEFNVGWHHGESGGPVVRIAEPMAAITVMQHYRNTTGPHGVVPGPRRGCALTAIQNDLMRLSANIV